MKPISRADLVALLRPHDPPCVSLHVPVDGREGSGPAAVKLANAARAARPGLDSWAAGDASRAPAAAAATASLESMVEQLSNSPWEPVDGAWRAPTRGLALFASPHFSALHRLASPPSDHAACDSAFHARPLVDQHAADLAFHLLAIHRDRVRLFEGSAERLDLLPLGDVPGSLELAVGREWDDSQQGRGFHGAPAAGKKRGGNVAATGIHSHGFGGSDRDEEKDMTRFLLRIGHGLPRGMGEAGHAPLLVMAVDKTLGLFRKLHPNVAIAEGGLAVDPGLLGPEELHVRAWQALAPVRERHVDAALEAVESGLARGRSSRDLLAIAQAAVAGRVMTLALANGKRDAGRLDPVTGELSLDGPGHHGPDVLEQLAAVVLLHRGDILCAPAERLHAHAAAIYRY